MGLLCPSSWVCLERRRVKHPFNARHEKVPHYFEVLRQRTRPVLAGTWNSVDHMLHLRLLVGDILFDAFSWLSVQGWIRLFPDLPVGVQLDLILCGVLYVSHGLENVLVIQEFHAHIRL